MTTPESLGLCLLGKEAVLGLFDLGDGVPSVTLKTKDESCGPSPKNMVSLSNPDRSVIGTCGDVPGEGDSDLV